MLHKNSDRYKYLFELLEDNYKRYNIVGFIKDDPISIPHSFSKKEDIEISAFWTAIFSWGQRKTIINKATELFSLMDNAPHDFILNHSEKDRKQFSEFKHRTFQYTDTLYFLDFLQKHYTKHDSLEEAFLKFDGNFESKRSFTEFEKYFFSLEHAPSRTRKHIASPARKSSCKKLNMFLRWMVRKDDKGVDFGLWERLKMKDLMIPLDVHVGRVARKLNILERKQDDWKAVEELTTKLRNFDPNDPVKYDYALFGMSLDEKQIF